MQYRYVGHPLAEWTTKEHFFLNPFNNKKIEEFCSNFDKDTLVASSPEIM